ncbi:MAG: enoyl-CoA hydratase/isomerase family protein [Thermoplasmatales archaeon]|nr:MAG: enoyl-CoA hydratase/isomerase family protein [Thermoplasmatales archaeon]
MKIQKIGIIGAGVMGSGIAQKAAQEGLQVVMVDVEDRFVQKGIENIKKTLSEAINRRIFTQEQTEKILSHIRGTTNKDEIKDADLVIEAVFENMDVKKDIFKYLDSVCEDKTVFASNTSSFSITELGSSVNRSDRFLGLHFFYHPTMNRLLEIIPSKDTSQKTISFADIFSRKISKIAIHVADSPGFAVNRFFVPWLNEATRLFEEDIANAPTIDDIAKKAFKIGMGPFELMNVTGIPIAYHSTVGLGNKLGDFYLPSNRLKQQFEKHESWDMGGEIDTAKTAIIEERLLGAVFIVACKLIEEEVSSIEDIDRGAKIGLRWELGPFEMMNKYGIEHSYKIVTQFVKKHPSLKVPTILKQLYEKKEEWRFNYVDLEITDKIARILINRPEAMNAINEEVIQQLDKQFTLANSDPNVKAIILEGAGKAFIAGADIQYFIKKIEEHKIEDICRFTRYGHSVLNKIDTSKKLVIAKLDGLALGGGAEIALAADTIIATGKGSIGFPETGIGIYPGLGGTQRTAQYIGKELAKYLIFTGKILDAQNAISIGLVEYVMSAEEIDRQISDLISSEKIVSKSKREIVELPEYFKKIKEYFSDTNIQDVLSGKGELNELGKKISKTISYKAPIAIKLANKIIDEGSRLDLNKGLELELSYLAKIFSTQDAYEGLNSVVMKRRPAFKGK